MSEQDKKSENPSWDQIKDFTKSHWMGVLATALVTAGITTGATVYLKRYLDKRKNEMENPTPEQSYDSILSVLLQAMESQESQKQKIQTIRHGTNQIINNHITESGLDFALLHGEVMNTRATLDDHIQQINLDLADSTKDRFGHFKSNSYKRHLSWLRDTLKHVVPTQLHESARAHIAQRYVVSPIDQTEYVQYRLLSDFNDIDHADWFSIQQRNIQEISGLMRVISYTPPSEKPMNSIEEKLRRIYKTPLPAELTVTHVHCFDQRPEVIATGLLGIVDRAIQTHASNVNVQIHPEFAGEDYEYPPLTGEMLLGMFPWAQQSLLPEHTSDDQFQLWNIYNQHIAKESIAVIRNTPILYP